MTEAFETRIQNGVEHCREKEYLEINEKYPVISTIPIDGGWEVQVVTAEINGYYGEQIAPNLEHAYVHFMENKLNQWTKV